MPCEWVKPPNGGVAIVKLSGRRRRKQKCGEAGCTNEAQYQCDGKVKRGWSEKTCDAWICEDHRFPAGEDIDYCPRHSRGLQLSMLLEAPVVNRYPGWKPHPDSVPAYDAEATLLNEGVLRPGQSVVAPLFPRRLR
jgi:hypothetical protein